MIFTPIRQLGEQLRSRALSPVALTEAVLERVETRGPAYNAVVTVTRERALAQARTAERELAAGHHRGPLHGIPYGAKDLLATGGGIPTTWGAAPLRDQTFDADATVIRKLEEAGAILVAKLAMVELAGGMGYRQPSASFTGPGINPWNPEHWSGGSSSGSGSAVAAGLVPFAIGSETWGSILSPAGFCCVAGLRPTYGRVSRHGAMTLSWTLDKIGPLALTADDCGLVLEAIAGPDPDDPSTIQAPFRYDHAGHDGRRRWRLGLLPQSLEGCEDSVRAAFDRSLADLGAIADVVEIALPDLPYEGIARVILGAEAASAFEDFVERGDLAGLTAPEDRYSTYARDAILARDYLRALRLRAIAAREADRVLAGIDAVVAPGRPILAPPLGKEFRSALRGTVNDTLGALGNLAGLPAVIVPSGFGPGGLPTSVQFVGRAHDENVVLAVARAYQACTDWHRRHPTS